MNSQYRGMRWYKCDLHMHTPADARHWQGAPLIEGKEAEAAMAFAEACFAQKLDVIGITEHNFLNKNFIPHLQNAFAEIERLKGHKITLFPGFEFEADVGKGIHVLCLFEPGSSIEEIDHMLTECGVRMPRVDGGRLAKSTKRLPDILNIVQKVNAHSTWRGLVIAPHIFEEGLFDNDKIHDWLQQEEYLNPELLAVEVPKPVSQMNHAFQKLFRSGSDCHQDWKRIRPIATLMSSDNKTLIETDEDSNPRPNSVGFRYSWIKMSNPSIEALRQAFLDHESRIILPENVVTDIHPAQRVRQATIKSISIKNVAFLADQHVHFSPNLNCVIGGRGSGKSTLLEYLRIIFDKDKKIDMEGDDYTEKRIQRVRETLKDPNTELEVCWASADGVEDCIQWKNGSRNVLGQELADPATFFKNLPLHFYSQQQLNRLTEAKSDGGSAPQAQRLLKLVDGFALKDLSDLANSEENLKLSLQDAFSNLRKSKRLEKEHKRLQQEYQELERQWKARSEIQEDAKKHQNLKAEERYLEGLWGTPGTQFTDVASLAEEIAESHEPFKIMDSPHAAWFREFDEKIKVAKNAAAKTIREAVAEFETTIEQIIVTDPVWNIIHDEFNQADEKFSEACAAKGLSPDDVGRLQEANQSRVAKQREINETVAKIQQLQDAGDNIDALMQQLHQTWRSQFQKRGLAASKANELATLNEGGQRFLEVSVAYQQDHLNFRELWQKFAPSDGRTRLAKNWETCGETLYSLFTQQADAESPWQILNNSLSEEEGSAGAEYAPNSQELYQYIQDNLERWEKLSCTRIQDSIDMKLFRPDGSPAGTISAGTLSDGQRNTAALALLLAQEGGPLIIDQPEDELDSNFVFRELIPMLRKVKSKRQLIMATHNANLPVNGDAELIYAFEAKDGKGELLACGGLDKPKVTKAVLDIMEGTEEAFRRRREKYNF